MALIILHTHILNKKWWKISSNGKREQAIECTLNV